MKAGVISPPVFFLFSFFFGVETGAAAHGRYRWHQIASAHLNTAFNGGICQQNMHFKVSRYSNGHEYPKQKQRTPNSTSFAQIGLAIMFTTNSCVKHRILHVLRDADAISHVKTGEINADVLIADVIKKCNF